MDLSSFFEFDESIRVWVEKPRKPFDYSDGEEQEKYILDALRSAADVSTTSTELLDRMVDWPSTYHLTPRRGNLLRPFQSWFAGKRILEIGCGCGAMTRFLGEAGATVISVEGSLMRATIARERCRDLSGIHIICTTSEKIDVLGEFDGVMLIGVLEYARKFLGPDGTQRLLADCTARLRDTGKLFVAIENQLGLKYFAGAAEDHTGVPMLGIEERYMPNGVATFGREELGRHLAHAHLEHQQWWYPFPDYKLPLSVLGEEAVSGQLDADFSSMIANASAADPQRPFYQVFSPERAWAPVYRNGLASALSNSFLVIASRRPVEVSDSRSVAFHYSVERLPAFAKALEIRKTDEGGLTTRHSRLYQAAESADESVKILPIGDTPYFTGEHWQHRLSQLLSEPGWSQDTFVDWYEQWFHALTAYAQLGVDRPMPALDAQVDSGLIDALPRNLIVDGTTAHFFDLEWKLGNSIEFGYVLFRGAYCSLWELRSVAEPAQGTSLRLKTLFESALARAHLKLSDEALERFAQYERDFQHSTAGRSSVDHDKVFNGELSVAPAIVSEVLRLNNELVGKDEAIVVQGSEIHRLNDVVREKGSIIDDLSVEVRALNERLQTELREKDAVIVQLGEDVRQLHAQPNDLKLQGDEVTRLHAKVLNGELSVAPTIAGEIRRLNNELVGKDEAIVVQGTEIHRLNDVVREKGSVIDDLSAEVRALNEQLARQHAYIDEKHTALAEQAKHIGELAARAQALLDAQNGSEGALARVSQERDSLSNILVLQSERIQEIERYSLKVESEQYGLQAELEATKHELARLRQTSDALTRTKWLRLRDSLIQRPVTPRQLARAAYLVTAMATPAFVKRPLFGFVSQGRRLLSPPADPVAPQLPSAPIARQGKGANSYIVRQRKPDLARRPRVLHVIANFMTGGSSKLVVDLIEGLGHRYQQTILTSFIPTPEAYTGVDIHEIRQPGEDEQFLSFIEAHRPDFIHAHYWGDCDEPWYAKAFATAEALGIPVVENINTPVAPFVSPSVVRYVYVSRYVEREFGTPGAPNAVIYPGSDFSLFSLKEGEKPSGTRVGMVYRLERDKLNEGAIVPFIRIAQMNAAARIVIVGGGSLLEPFKASVEEAGVADQFEFTGYVSYDELPGLYRQMAVFVAPVWKESFGQVSPFAMNMQVPVVGYDVGAIGEIIDNEKYLAPAADAERLAQIVDKLLRNDAERNTLALRHRARAQQYFSLDAMVSSYRALYDEVQSALVIQSVRQSS